LPRAATTSIAAVIEAAVQSALSKVLPGIQRAINRAVEARLRDELALMPKRGRAAVRRAARSEITRWVADNRARRVPNFVIEATGLDTKKKVVAKYGENAAFAKGKPLPPVKLAAVPKEQPREPAAQPVKAKPPVIRKRAAAGK
jgi:hypothetical protein